MPIRQKPIFVRPLDLGTIATGNETAGHPAIHINRPRSIGLTWKSTGNSNVWARGELAEARDIDFLAVLAANALPGTQIQLRLGTSQAEVDGGSAPYDSGAVPFINPTPAATPADRLYHSHLELPAPVNATWWRIDITGHTGDFEASIAVLGEKIQPSRFYDREYEWSPQDLGSLDIGRWGVFDEKDGLIFRSTEFRLSWQDEEEYETKFRPLVEAVGQRRPIYCCFDPEPTSYRQARTYFGVLRKPSFARGVLKPGTLAQEFSFLSMI